MDFAMNLTKKSRWAVGTLWMGAGACLGPAPDLAGGEASSASSSAGSSSESSTGEPLPTCVDPQPLADGDAPWDKPPFDPPGDMGQGGGDDDGGFDDAGFIQDPDGGGVSIECDGWAQDCQAGEKCMPWANDGGMTWNAMRCSPLAPDPALAGEACTVEGAAFSGI